MVFLITADCITAQVRFSAVFTPAEIGKDEYATLRIIIENANDIENLTLPSFKDFTLAGGPNQESGMSNVNGVETKYIGLSYILKPRRTGNYVLPAATAVINGKKYRSSPIKLLVKKRSTSTTNPGNNPFVITDPFAVQQPREEFRDFILRKGEQVPDKINKNMQMVLQTDKTSCYVGEPVVASYKLFTRLKNESRLVKNPSFNGFSVIDLQQPDVTAYAREKLNGREYNVYTIRKAQLYPLQSGPVELETAQMENRIQFLKEEAQNIDGNIDGFLNDIALAPGSLVTETVTLSSKPVIINVKPLPEKGKPASFNGAVGKFELSASLEKNNFSADEAGKLKVVISGQGNLQLVTLPDIKWPQQIEAFESKVTDELAMTDVPVSGRKIFEIPFTVQAEGKYQVPVIEFAYFDPATASYHIVRSDSLLFSVNKAANRPAYTADTISAGKTKSFSQKIGENRGWVITVIAILILSGLFFWIRHDKNQYKQEEPLPVTVTPEPAEEESIKEIAEESANNPLKLTEECLGTADCDHFYTLLNMEFKTFLSRKFSLQLQEVNAKNISLKMDAEGIANETCLQTQALMREIEWQLYTPFERNDTMHELYARSTELLHQLSAGHHTTR